MHKRFHSTLFFFLFVFWPLLSEGVSLTDEEQAWIKENPVVTFVGDPDWLPFEAFDENKQYIGIVSDYLSIIENKTGLRFEIIPTDTWTESKQLAMSGEAKVISGTSVDATLNQSFTPLKPYFKNPIVIVMNSDSGFVDDVRGLKGKKIAIIKNYGYTSDIYREYPDIEFLEVENAYVGLMGVSTGIYDAMLGSMALISYKISEIGLHGVKIVGQTPVKMQVTLFIDKSSPMLMQVIGKALEDIPYTTRHKILDKWVSDLLVGILDVELVLKTLGVITIILLLMFYRNRLIKRHNDKLKEKNNQLSYISRTDALTKACNRRYCDEILSQQISQARRHPHNFSVVLIDIDHFKSINDTYGHQAGDEVLIKISEIMMTNIRDADYFGRWGGEEFMIICPQIESAEASKMAEKLRRLLEAYSFSGVGKVTASFGVTSYSDGDTIDDLIKRSDTSLYKAKENGRNRIEVAC